MKVIAACGEVHTNEEATLYVKDLDLCVPALRGYTASSDAWATLRGSWIFLWVDRSSKSRYYWKRQENTMQYRELRANSCHRPFKRIFQKRRNIQNRSLARGNSEQSLELKESDNSARRSPVHDLPELLEEFTEHLVDEEASIPEAAGPRKPIIPELPPKVESGNLSMFTYFPKGRNCELCRRTNITRAPCRKRSGNSIPRAEKFGNLITADHKVLGVYGESRNDHRYAVIVQDLATQRPQASLWKTRIHRKRKRVYETFSSRRKSQKSFILTIH